MRNFATVVVFLFISISVFTSCERELKKGDKVYVEVKTNTLRSWTYILHKELKCASRIEKICIVGEMDFPGYEKCTKCMSENDILIIEARKNEKQETYNFEKNKLNESGNKIDFYKKSKSDDSDKKWLYEKFKGNGLNIGEYDDFNKSLSNEEDRKWYYQKAKSLDLNIGSYDDFGNMLDRPKGAKKVYDALQRDGIKINNISSEAEFYKKLYNRDSRERLYNILQKKQYDDIGSTLEEFEKKIGYYDVIPQDEKNLRGVYSTLKKEGYTPPEYEVFKKDMQDEKNLRGVYSTLKKEGYTPPEYEVFKKDMGFKGVQKSRNK